MAAPGDDYWCAALGILASRDEKKPQKDLKADIDEWLFKVTKKIAKERKLALEHAPKKTKEPIKKERQKSFEFLEISFGKHIEMEISFNNPRIKSRLEKLMGTNVVRITDRNYMIKLQERIKEDHLENQMKRIQAREKEEVEREKKLILEGKIPLEQAPKELQDHPVCKINQITKKILENKKSKTKAQNKIAAYRTTSKKIKESECGPKETDEGVKEEEDKIEEDDKAEDLCTADMDPEERIERGFMFSQEEYEKLKYESPLVKKLKECENVEDMYTMAEEILGPLKHVRTSK